MHPAGINVVWSLIQGLQICKPRSYRLYTYIPTVHLKLANLFVEKQVMLPATLPDIESETLAEIANYYVSSARTQ